MVSCFVIHLALMVALPSIFRIRLTASAASPVGSSNRAGAGSAKVEYRYLRALPCSGSYSPGGVYSEYLRAMRLKQEVDIENGFVKAEREELPAFFLAPSKIATEECEFGENRELKCVLRNILPVPIRSAVAADVEGSLLAAMKTNRPVEMMSWNSAVITDRNRGLYDNLFPFLQKLASASGVSGNVNDIKKKLIEYLRLQRSNFPSPYHAYLAALEAVCGIKVTGLLIEVADTINEVSLSLGAAVMFSKKESSSEWILKTNNFRKLSSAEKSSTDCKFVNCYMDELMGCHLATGIPVIIANSLYSRVCVDGLLEQKKSMGLEDGSMFMQSPFFDNLRDSVIWQKQLEEGRAKPAKAVPKVNEILDATSFLKMRLSEKRACLRASGVYALPRPREGPKKVDAIMIPLLDEEVAYEVLRRLGETRGDFDLAAKMQDFESRKPVLAKRYNQAVRDGDVQLAKELCDEINAIATLRYDPNNPDDETVAGKGGFDIEEWYYEQRKRIYGIIA